MDSLWFVNEHNRSYGRFDAKSWGWEGKSKNICTNTPKSPTIQLWWWLVPVSLKLSPIKRLNPMAYMEVFWKHTPSRNFSFNQTIPLLTAHLYLIHGRQLLPDHYPWEARVQRSEWVPPCSCNPCTGQVHGDISHLIHSTTTRPLQFAYKTHRESEDATLTTVNMVVSHLQTTNTYV